MKKFIIGLLIGILIGLICEKQRSMKYELEVLKKEIASTYAKMDDYAKKNDTEVFINDSIEY